MNDFHPPRLLAAALSAGLALTLAGCMGATYGTGKSTTLQTIEDIAGIASLSGGNKEKIDYAPRPQVVAPPAAAVGLPPPQEESNTKLAANWPQDPDATAAKIKAAAADSEDGIYGPNFRLPKGSNAATQPVPLHNNDDFEKEAMRSASDPAAVRKRFAEAKGLVAVDSAGNPVRRYLTDPPNDYRIPDPNEPVAIPEKTTTKKKWKWWWQ